MSEQINLKSRRVVSVVLFSAFRLLAITGLVAIVFEELLPEPIAKPIVVGTVLVNICYHVWSWRKIRRIHR
jgi:hypothetical protein